MEAICFAKSNEKYLLETNNFFTQYAQILFFFL